MSADYQQTRFKVLKQSNLPLFCLLLGFWFPTSGWSDDVAGALHVNENIVNQRVLYLVARDALAAGHQNEYKTLHEQLAGYPLLPYLEYASVSSQMSSVQVDDFLARYPGSYLADRLRRAWVSELAIQQQWAEIVKYPEVAGGSTVLSCYLLHARLETGDISALADVPDLWNVPRSQPNECDPVFEVWMAQQPPSAELIWRRFSSTLEAGQSHLARYITTLMPPSEKKLADVYLQIEGEPARLKNNQALISTVSPETLEIVEHGIRKFARIDASQALSILYEYHAMYHFDDSTLLELQRYVALRMLLQGYAEDTEKLLDAAPLLINETIAGWLLRDALKNQDWNSVEKWLDRLPEESRTSERWQYWRARMLERKGTPDALAEATAVHQALARTRSFYGFLSADWLGQEYALVDKPVVVSDSELSSLYEIPAIVRAYELYQLGDEIDARNEWRYATQSMTSEQILGSGKLADSWGWHRNSIQAMIQASYWDDLQLRFPLAYGDAFTLAATQQATSPNFLLALARQESAFMYDVRSPAGARGLMQLMPATARQTASGMGMNISTEDLYTPEINIAVGSKYMGELLQQFDGNRALAAAGYNAGPNRVKQWLRNSGDNPVPLDIWIETIPFTETRNYVQNVLAYAVIYAYRRGEAVQFLTEEEASSRF